MKVIEGKTASVSKLALEASCLLARRDKERIYALTEIGTRNG